MSDMLARRYGRAFFDVARESGDIRGRGSQLADATGALGMEEIARTLANPRVGVADRIALVQSANGFSPDVRNLLRLLVERGRSSLLPAILAEYRRLADRESGVLRVEVTAAIPLDDELRSAIDRSLSERLQRDVHTEVREDRDILGGLIIRIGDRVIDNSVRTHLERLRASLV